MFQYKNTLFEYCINAHNTRGSLTERVVEIPLLGYALKNMSNPIEIGCVSPYYWDVYHEIYDLTDTHRLCKNVNARDIDINDKNIISISTIEHFDVENYDINHTEYIDSIRYLQLIVEKANKYLVSVPLGYNPRLTDFILTQTNFTVNFMARNLDNTWSQYKAKELSPTQIAYNRNIWYANSIAIIENIFL